MLPVRSGASSLLPTQPEAARNKQVLVVSVPSLLSAMLSTQTTIKEVSCMSLEARVAELEENRVHWDQVLTGVEGTVALILNEQRDKFKEVDRRFNVLEREHNNRFNKIEELLIQIVNNLASK